jgi:hypothetical protein
MTDPAPHDTTADEPAPPATAAAADPVLAKAPWYGRRVPLLVSGAALILGCLLGGGVVAIAAFAVDGDHGDDRGSHSNRDERADGRGNGGDNRHEQNRDGGGRNNDDQPNPAPSTSAGSAPASTPTPSASA